MQSVNNRKNKLHVTCICVNMYSCKHTYVRTTYNWAWHLSRIVIVLNKMQFQFWLDSTQLINEVLLIIKPLYGQLLQGGVSTSSLEYGFHHTAVSNVHVQHLEWLVAFNGSFHLLQECCIDHFLHNRKQLMPLTSLLNHMTHTHTASYCAHDTHTLPHIVYACPHAC